MSAGEEMKSRRFHLRKRQQIHLDLDKDHSNGSLTRGPIGLTRWIPTFADIMVVLPVNVRALANEILVSRITNARERAVASAIEFVDVHVGYIQIGFLKGILTSIIGVATVGDTPNGTCVLLVIASICKERTTSFYIAAGYDFIYHGTILTAFVI